MIPTLDDHDLSGQTVLVQISMDVPKEDGAVSDDTRLRASAPTIERLVSDGCTIILCGHVGRPDGHDPSLSTRPVAERLSELLGQRAAHVPHVVGPDAESAVRGAEPGSVLVLENLRYDSGQLEPSQGFAERLSALADAFVNDDYPDAHRESATNTLVPHILPSCAGPSLVSEYETVRGAVESPDEPFVLVVGGAKADKIGAINNVLGFADKILVGGVLANTFLKASGVDVQASKYDERSAEIAGEFLREQEEKFVLPVDVVAAEAFSGDARHDVYGVDEIPDGWMVLDVGPKTVERYRAALEGAETIVWGGPIGVYEWDSFRNGTVAVARALAESGAYTLVGGGDSGDAVHDLGLADRMGHVSIGGGVTLALLAGKELPAIEALRKIV